LSQPFWKKITVRPAARAASSTRFVCVMAAGAPATLKPAMSM
jgi:hypothetical protein